MSKEEKNMLNSFFKEVEEEINRVHLKYEIDVKIEECPTSERYTIYKIRVTKRAKEEVIYE